MKNITYKRALEIDQIKRGFFLWWNGKYVTPYNTHPTPSVESVINDSIKERKDYSIAIYIALKLSGVVSICYPTRPELHKVIKFRDGKQVAYTVYAPKSKLGFQTIIAQKKERGKAVGLEHFTGKVSNV